MNKKIIHNNKQVAVIGAGIIGVNCALTLQQLGFQVTLLDKKGIGEGCSERNAGHFATEQVFPLAEADLLFQLPKLLLDPLGPMALSPCYFPKALPWFMRFIMNMLPAKRFKNGQAIKNLNKHAIDYYRPLLKQANAEHLLTAKGSLLTFEQTPFTHVKQAWQHYHDANIAVEILDRSQLLILEPNLNERINYALYFTDVAHSCSPKDICLALGNEALNQGARFQKFSVEKISNTQESVMLCDHQTTIRFDHVVIATGAWSKTLLAQLGYNLPLEAERGYSLDLSKAKTPELNRPVASAERRFIMTPMAHGLRLSGTVEFAGLKQKANMKRADILYTHAREMLTTIAPFEPSTADENQRWLGFRPSLPDSLPVICQAPKHKNIFCALGHQHLGLTQGAITGKLIGQIIVDEKTDIDITPFCLSRFN